MFKGFEQHYSSIGWRVMVKERGKSYLSSFCQELGV